MIDASNLQYNSQSCHFARSAGTSFQIVVPNWYVVQGGAETNTGGTLTLFAAANVNGGTLTRITWSAASSIAIADGATAVSDSLALSFNSGDTICVREFGTAAAGRTFGINNLTTAIGDALNVATSGLSDLTLGGVITNNSSTNFITPAAIIASITAPSIAIIGDSICHGTGDTVDTTGDMGSIARSIGPTFAYMNLCVGSDQAHLFVASHAKRVALINSYASHVVNAEGRNDLNASRTAAQLEADMLTISGYFGGQPIVATTIAPTSTSSDSWATTGNQAQGSDHAQRTTYDTVVRSGLSWAAHFSEIALALEFSDDIWKVTGLANGYTADGVHPNHAAELNLVLGTTNTAWFVRTN